MLPEHRYEFPVRPKVIWGDPAVEVPLANKAFKVWVFKLPGTLNHSSTVKPPPADRVGSTEKVEDNQ